MDLEIEFERFEESSNNSNDECKRQDSTLETEIDTDCTYINNLAYELEKKFQIIQ